MATGVPNKRCVQSDHDERSGPTYAIGGVWLCWNSATSARVSCT